MHHRGGSAGEAEVGQDGEDVGDADDAIGIEVGHASVGGRVGIASEFRQGNQDVGGGDEAVEVEVFRAGGRSGGKVRREEVVGDGAGGRGGQREVGDTRLQEEAVWRQGVAEDGAVFRPPFGLQVATKPQGVQRGEAQCGDVQRVDVHVHIGERGIDALARGEAHRRLSGIQGVGGGDAVGFVHALQREAELIVEGRVEHAIDEEPLPV